MTCAHSKWRLFWRFLNGPTPFAREVLLSALMLSFGRPHLNEAQLIHLAYWGYP